MIVPEPGWGMVLIVLLAMAAFVVISLVERGTF